MKQNETESCEIVAPKFHCAKCDYFTSRKSSYDKHLTTDKHKMKQNETNSCTKVAKANSKICECGFVCNSRTTLWRHKKKFHSNNEEASSDSECESNDDDIIPEITDKEIIKTLLEIVKNGTHNINTNSHNNICNNKTFNLNVFLNETCKDAMNIDEFVSSIKVDLDDLENTGRTGYVEGITNIIVKNLNNIEQHLRPLHCSDLKREVIYIKDKNEWTKETDEKPILINAIKVIANENIKQIKNWSDKYPDCVKAHSKKNDLYLKIVSNSMNGLTKEEGNRNIERIISNIVKQVTINKSAK